MWSTELMRRLPWRAEPMMDGSPIEFCGRSWNGRRPGVACEGITRTEAAWVTHLDQQLSGADESQAEHQRQRSLELLEHLHDLVLECVALVSTGAAQAGSSRKARLGCAPARQALCQPGRQLGQQRLSFIQQAPMPIDDLFARADEYGQSVAVRVRLTGLCAFERVRQVGVCQELAGNGLCIDAVAFAATRPPTTARRSTGRTDVAHVCASLHQSHSKAAPPGVAAFDGPHRARGVLAGPHAQLVDRLTRRAAGPQSQPATPRVQCDRVALAEAPAGNWLACR
jgi:hypothetical protein